MIGSLATIGYAEKSYKIGVLTELECALRVNPNALIIDTRLSPRCYWSEHWRRPWLTSHFKHRYYYKGDWLGNVNYDDPDKGIELVDPDRGILWLSHQLEQGQTLILLCGCVHYHQCHRKVIYDLVRSRLAGLLPEYWLDQQVMTPDGPGTISPDTPLDIQRARNRYSVLLDYPRHLRYSFPYELKPYHLVQQSLIA